MERETAAPIRMVPENALADIPAILRPPQASRFNFASTPRASLRVLSAEDWAFWRQNGYVVVKQAVPRENTGDWPRCCGSSEKDPNDPSTWYAPARAEMKMKELTNSGMVELYNH